jgi:tyrosine-protein phosphatase YwqE
MIDLHLTYFRIRMTRSRSGEAKQMMAVARKDGIFKIVLTPHVFRMTKHSDGLGGLKGRMRTFLEQPKAFEVDLFAGAEVYVHADMVRNIKDFGLTVNGSSYVFIEFPAELVPAGTTRLVYQMMLDD